MACTPIAAHPAYRLLHSPAPSSAAAAWFVSFLTPPFTGARHLRSHRRAVPPHRCRCHSRLLLPSRPRRLCPLLPPRRPLPPVATPQNQQQMEGRALRRQRRPQACRLQPARPALSRQRLATIPGAAHPDWGAAQHARASSRTGHLSSNSNLISRLPTARCLLHLPHLPSSPQHCQHFCSRFHNTDSLLLHHFLRFAEPQPKCRRHVCMFKHIAIARGQAGTAASHNSECVPAPGAWGVPPCCCPRPCHCASSCEYCRVKFK